MSKIDKKYGFAGIGAGAVVVLVLLIWMYAGDSETGSGSARAAVRKTTPVVVAEIRKTPFLEILEGLGTVTANESVTLNPTVKDRVTDLFFEDGDAVEAGQVLVRLSDDEEKSLLKEAKAALKEQQLQYERVRNLVKRKAVSQAQLEEAEGLLKRVEAQVANLEARLSDHTIRAPFSGVLGIRQVSPGAVVDTDTVITTLDDLSLVHIDFSAPETYMSELRPGLSVTARSKAYPDRTFEGTVSVVDTRVDPVSRSVTVRANIPNPDYALKPGMLLTVDVIRKETETLMVPEEAIFMEKERKFVWMVDAQNGVIRREITTDRRRPGDVEVLSGLEVGDRVIVQGVNRVREGASVDVVEVESPTGA